MTQYIRMFSDVYTAVDDCDYEHLNQFHWTFEGRYACRTENGKKIYLHRYILNAPSGMFVDHINGDKLDNRRCNIRLTTRSGNEANKPKISKATTSKFKGVCWHKQRGKWKAEIKKNGSRKHLGLFESEVDAAIAYNMAAKALFGELSRQNLI